jgi:tetratricopeptide (TPR) repeat protein
MSRGLGKIWALQIEKQLCTVVLFGSLAISAAAAQSLGENVPAPQRPPALAEKADLPGGSACSAFGLEPNSEASSICSRASQAYSSDNWEEARQMAAELTQRYPRSGVGNFWLAHIEFKQGNNFSAVRKFEAAVDLNPDIELLHIDLGLCYLAIRQYRLFKQEMHWVIAQNPHIPLPYYYLGQYFLNNLDQPEKAVEYFQEALRTNPTDFRSRYHLGYIAEMKNELDRAMAEYKLALATATTQRATFSWPLQGLARVHMLKEDLPEALHYAQQAVSMEPKLASNRTTLGKLYIQTGEVSKGIEELKRTIELDPTDATCHYLLSRGYMKLKMPVEAEREQKLFLEMKAAYGDE